MQTLFVLSPVGKRNAIAKLVPKAGSFDVKVTPFGVRTGMVFGPSIRSDIVRAAHYLVSESAAVSCVCAGYTVTK